MLLRSRKKRCIKAGDINRQRRRRRAPSSSGAAAGAQQQMRAVSRLQLTYRKLNTLIIIIAANEVLRTEGDRERVAGGGDTHAHTRLITSLGLCAGLLR